MKERKELRNWSNYKKATKNIVKEAKHLLLIAHYNIDIRYIKEESDILASCECGEVGIKYSNAILNFYPKHFKSYKDKNDYQFVKNIIHEMCHIITEPLYLEAYQSFAPISRNYLEIIREQTTEKIANIIYLLWKSK